MIAPLGQTIASVAPATGAGRPPAGFGDLLRAATDQPAAPDHTPRAAASKASGDPAATAADLPTGADRPAWVAQPATKLAGTPPPILAGKVADGAPSPAGSSIAPEPPRSLKPASAGAAATLHQSGPSMSNGSPGALAGAVDANAPPAGDPATVGRGSAPGHPPSRAIPGATAGAVPPARATGTTPGPGDPVDQSGDSQAVASSDPDGEATPGVAPSADMPPPSGCAAVQAGVALATHQATATPNTATTPAMAPTLPAIAAASLAVPSSAPGLHPPGPRKAAGEAATDEASDRSISGEVAAVPVATALATVPSAAGTAHPAPHAPGAHPSAAAMPDPVNRHLQLAQDGAWLDGVARDIAATADPAGRLRFTLTPLHLGRLEVQMAPEERGTAVRLVTADPVSHRLLADAQPQLLASAPLGGQITSATIDFAGGQAGAQAFGNQNSGGGAGTGTDRRPAPPPPVRPAPPATPPGADELYA